MGNAGFMSSTVAYGSPWKLPGREYEQNSKPRGILLESCNDLKDQVTLKSRGPIQLYYESRYGV